MGVRPVPGEITYQYDAKARVDKVKKFGSDSANRWP